MTAVENKISDVISLVKKADYNSKITKIENTLTDHSHDEYITTLVLYSRSFWRKIRTRKSSNNNLVFFGNKLKRLNEKINSSKRKIKINLKKTQKFDSICFRGKNHLKKMLHKVI